MEKIEAEKDTITWTSIQNLSEFKKIIHRYITETMIQTLGDTALDKVANAILLSSALFSPEASATFEHEAFQRSVCFDDKGEMYSAVQATEILKIGISAGIIDHIEGYYRFTNENIQRHLAEISRELD